MNLLISELQPLEAVLDWPIRWAEDLDAEVVPRAIESEPSDYQEPLPADRLPAWYEPRILALRLAIAGE